MSLEEGESEKCYRFLDGCVQKSTRPALAIAITFTFFITFFR